MLRPTLSQLQAQVAAWNAAHDIGTPVTARKFIGGSTITTVTASRAYLHGHAAAVCLLGVAGPIALDRIRPGKPEVLAEKVA